MKNQLNDDFIFIISDFNSNSTDIEINDELAMKIFNSLNEYERCGGKHNCSAGISRVLSEMSECSEIAEYYSTFHEFSIW